MLYYRETFYWNSCGCSLEIPTAIHLKFPSEFIWVSRRPFDFFLGIYRISFLWIEVLFRYYYGSFFSHLFKNSLGDFCGNFLRSSSWKYLRILSTIFQDIFQKLIGNSIVLFFYFFFTFYFLFFSFGYYAQIVLWFFLDNFVNFFFGIHVCKLNKLIIYKLAYDFLEFCSGFGCVCVFFLHLFGSYFFRNIVENSVRLFILITTYLWEIILGLLCELFCNSFKNCLLQFHG